MIEGSGSIPPTNGSRSRRPKTRGSDSDPDRQHWSYSSYVGQRFLHAIVYTVPVPDVGDHLLYGGLGHVREDGRRLQAVPHPLLLLFSIP
jgi:hypothetical protein